MSMEGEFAGETPPDELSVVAGVYRYRFACGATIKRWRKRIVARIREMLVVGRGRQPDDGGERTNTDGPGDLGHFIEAHSPILQWLRGRD
jgi:hypothetical protein